MGSVTQQAFEFGEFRLERDGSTLSRAGYPLRLERKPLELLLLLVERNGELVSRTEIAERLWGAEVFVDVEHGINTAIRKARYALRDDSDDPRYIQTVTGKGYRFLAAVSVTAATNGARAHNSAFGASESASVLSAVEATPESSSGPAGDAPKTPQHLRVWRWLAMATVVALAVAMGSAVYHARVRRPEIDYMQLTDLTDSAVTPAVSPDGHMVAFLRGSHGFLSEDPIYVQALPGGEPRLLTADRRPKYGLRFSPDGSQVVYTVLEGVEFSTYAVSLFGGNPQLFLHDAAGLSWLDNDRLLFSKARSGIHLGLVTGTLTEGAQRDLYFPEHERGMVHDAHASPDRKWALAVEMAGSGDWGPCRLVPLDGSAPTRQVGPSGPCIAAGWSRDGSWMYFDSVVREESHLWRQRFPHGAPQQITFGPTEEDGLAVDQSGDSIITSLGTNERTLWLHDSASDRPISSEGEVLDTPPPRFVRDGSALYFLLRRRTAGSGAELWRYSPATGSSEAVLPGIAILGYDIAPDGDRVAYTTQGADGISELWTAPANRSSVPVRWRARGALSPQFGRDGAIYAMFAEGSSDYIGRVKDSLSAPIRAVPYHVVEFNGVSPGGRWLIAGVPNLPSSNQPAPAAIPLDGGPPVRLCASYCLPIWSADGRYLFIQTEQATDDKPGRSLAIPIGVGDTLPALPPGGIVANAEASEIRGATSVPRGFLFAAGAPTSYAYMKTTMHRNLFRLTLH